LATTFGTSIECVADSIEEKEKSLAGAYLEGITEKWLLIHATGSLVSSRITPMTRGMISDLLASEAAAKASVSGFDRVYLWDGVHGGSVDLKSGHFHEPSLAN
jgi:hypothetical protein